MTIMRLGARKSPVFMSCAPLQGGVNNMPMSAVPNYGGKTSEGASASQHRWGIDRVPTPREIVAALDQYVVGQVGAQLGNCTHLI